MYRYRVVFHGHMEVEAENKEEAYDMARQFTDAVEEGEGDEVVRLSLDSVLRVRILYDSCTELHVVGSEGSRFLKPGQGSE